MAQCRSYREKRKTHGVILLELFPKATAAGRARLSEWAPLSLRCYTLVYAHTHAHTSTCTRSGEHMLTQDLAETDQIRVYKRAFWCWDSWFDADRGLERDA